MAHFRLSGSHLRRLGPIVLASGLCLAVTVTAVLLLERQRVAPDLPQISQQHAILEQARQRLEALPPVQPVHWQMRRLRLLAQVTPGIHDLQTIAAAPQDYSETVNQRLGNFGGAVWQVSVQGSFAAIVQLCRTAQPLMPLIVDSIRVRSDVARATLFVLGARPSTDPT